MNPPGMGNKVQYLAEAGLRQVGFAGALARDITERLAVESGRERGSVKQCLLVRGFDGLRAVSSHSRVPRMAARKGVPTARLGQRVVGSIARGSEILGSPTLARVAPSVTGRALVVVL